MYSKRLSRLALSCLAVSLWTTSRLEAQSSFSNAVANLGPAAYWPLQETINPPAADVETNLGSLGAAGNAYYSSTNVVKGISPGAIVSDSDPAAGFQSSLNGSFLAVPLSDSRVSLPVGPFTVETWIYPTNTSASTVIAQTGVAGTGGLNNGAGSAGWSLNLGYIPSLRVTVPNTISFHVYNGDGSTGGAEATFSAGPLAAAWYHVVAVYDGANAMLYVNAAPGSPMAPMSGAQARDTWDPLTIGCGRGLNNNRFGGSLDEVAIYTNALTYNQLSNHWYIGTTGSGNYAATVQADRPYLYWRLNAPVYSAPTPDSYPVAANYGTAGAGGLYLPGTTPGAAGPSFSGLGSPSYACAFNGIGTANQGLVGFANNGVLTYSNAASSGIFITNVDPALNLSSNSISFMTWFKSNPADDRFQALAGHGNSGWRLAMGSGGNAGKLQWNYGAGSDLVSTRSYNDGQWHFVVGVYTNSGVPATPYGWLATNYLYVDGILDNSAQITNLASATSTTNILLGGAPDYAPSGNGNVYRPQRFFAGSLAQAAYFTNALTADQVAGLYAAAGGVPLPVIAGQPITGRTNSPGTGNNGSGPGSYIYFGVLAQGATGYQWYFNSSSNYSGATLLSDGDKYSGSGTLQITVTNLADADSGYYYVVVTNNYGSVTSILASLQVYTEPLITSQTPPGGTLQLYQNQSYTLSVSAIGETNFTYQWYTNGVADTAAGTNASYPLSSVQPAMSGNTYQCIVGNPGGSATNELVTLSVQPLPGNVSGSSYANAVLGMNPSGYWPMHETAPPAPGDVETNLGSLGNLANGYYADWTGAIAGTGIVHQVSGALAGDPDPATGFNDTPNNASTVYPGFMVIPRTAPATTLSAPFTIELWAKPFTSGFGDILSENGSLNGVNNQNDGVRLSWGSGGGGNSSSTFQVYVGSGTSRPSFASGSFPVNQWYHLAVTYDGTTWTLYVNGNAVKTSTLSYAVDTGGPICLAQGLWNGNGGQRGFPGAIDEVALYKNVLDPNEILNHYNAGINPNASPAYKQLVLATNPIVYLRMDAPAYTPPPVSTWPVVANYGSVGGNGVYSPGSVLGAIDGPNALGLSGSKALAGNGMSSFAEIPYDPSFDPTTNAFSFSAWFKGNPADTRSWQTIVGHSDSSFRAAFNSSGKLQAHAGGGDLQSPTLLNDGQWHQFVMTYSGTNAATSNFGTNTLYVDGVAVATGTGVANAGSPADLFIGDDPQFTNSPYGMGRSFAGSVCEVAFWNNLALSSNQVATLWNAAGVPPAIVTQPSSANLNQGATFTNSVVVSGSQPLHYQWYFGNTPLNGQTDASIVFDPVVDENAGTYYVVATNNFGSVTSAVVTLSVFSAPLVRSQTPIPYTNLFLLYAGASPTFSVLSVRGQTPLGYQWYTNGIADVSGTNSTYQLHNVAVGFLTNYCVITNAIGAGTSFVWTAQVIAAPAAPFPQAVLGLSPIGYWRLNEADDGRLDGNPGALTHDYAGGNDGIYTNTLLGQTGYSTGLASQYGNPALATDPTTTSAQFGSLGSVDNAVLKVAGIDFASPTNTNRGFSVAAWVNGNSQSTAAGIVTKGYGNGGEQFDLDTGSGSFHAFRFFVRNASGTTTAASSTVVPDGRWHYLVGVCDQSNGVVNLFIDGLLQASGTIAPGSGILAATNLMSIGARMSSGTSANDDQFFGNINDVAVYNYPLSAGQVASNYGAAGVAPQIAQQPPAVTNVSENGTLIVPAVAIGTPTLAYQWQDNSGPIPGQTTATLVYSNVPAALNGDTLFLTVTNQYGSVNSIYVALTVNSGAPQITVSNLPAKVTLPLGKTYTYSVTAAGTLPISYQWYNGGTAVDGATNPEYTVTGSALGNSTISISVTNIDGSTSGSSLLSVIGYPNYNVANQVLGLGPVGYWPLQETTPPAPVTMETNLGTLGSLGNAFYAMNDEPSSRIAFGQGGALANSGDSDTAVTFSGTGGTVGTNYAFVPHYSPALTMKAPLTYEVWLNSSSTAFSDIMGQGGSGVNTPVGDSTNWGGIRLSYGGNVSGGPNLQVYAYLGGKNNFNSFATPANSLPRGQWHHCVMTFDGTNCVLYIDGQGRATNSTAIAPMVPDVCTPLTIGDGRWLGDAGTYGPTRSFNGMLDEVAVYTNVLSPDRVAAHYVAGSTTTDSNYVQAVQADRPMLYYRMDAQGFVAPDPGTDPVAVNYGSAPVNAIYPGGVVPGGWPGPSIIGLNPSMAAPINGVTACIDAGNDPAFNPTANQPFSAMICFQGYPCDGRVQTLMSHGVNNWAMNLDGGTGHVVWNLYNGGQVTSTTVLNDGNWHMVVGVSDGATSSLYVDGVLDNSGPLLAGLAGEPNADLFLGGNADFTSVGINQRNFAGAISQAAFFTNALTAQQVQSLFAAAAAPPSLSATMSGNNLVITYSGTLLSSTNVAGPYTPVTGAHPPSYSVVPGNEPQRFYRAGQ